MQYQRIEYIIPVYDNQTEKIDPATNLPPVVSVANTVSRDISKVVSHSSVGVFAWMEINDSGVCMRILNDAGQTFDPPSTEYRLANGGKYEVPPFPLAVAAVEEGA